MANDLNGHSYVTNDANAIINPDLHDAEIVAIELVNDVHIRFKLVSDELVSVRLIDVKQICFDNLRQGNIVLDVTVSTNEKLTAKDKQKLFGEIQYGNSRLSFYIDALDENLQCGNLKLIRINPSYGCNMVAICQNLVFE